MKIFASEKGNVQKIIIWAVIGLLSGLFIKLNDQTGFEWKSLILLCPFLVILWIWLQTNYTIANDILTYRSGPFFGKIKVNSIHKLVVNKTLWVGFRPALALRGIVVKYNQYDEIYFSPKDKAGFIQALIDQNPSIEVEYEE